MAELIYVRVTMQQSVTKVCGYDANMYIGTDNE